MKCAKTAEYTLIVTIEHQKDTNKMEFFVMVNNSCQFLKCAKEEIPYFSSFRNKKVQLYKLIVFSKIFGKLKKGESISPISFHYKLTNVIGIKMFKPKRITVFVNISLILLVILKQAK